MKVPFVTEPGAISFTLSDVRAVLRSDAFARGEAYARGDRVSGLKVSNAGNTIAARVRGSQRTPYEVIVYVSRARSGRNMISGYCTCPVAADCKHVAATLLVALELHAAQSRVSAATSESLPSERPRDEVATETDARVEQWLSELRESVASNTESVAIEERVAYVFAAAEKSTGRTFPVDIVVTRLTKAGRWTKVRDATADSLATATARAVAPEDAILGRLMQAYERTYRDRVSFAEDIVRRIIATGRAYLAALDTPPLALGPPRNARVEWTLARDGTQRPVLAFEDARTVVLPAPAPWYVEPETGLAGPVDAGLPSAALGAFLGAPPLAPAQAQRVRKALAGTVGEASLPASLVITERVERVDPVPILTLRTIELRAQRFAMWGDVAPGPERVDIAEWSFAYGNVTIDPASAERELHGVVAGQSVVYARSRAAEDRAAKRLANCGLVIDTELNGNAPLSGTCLRFVGMDEALWPSFVHVTVPTLRAAGWRVEIDASFRHRVLDGTGDDAWQARADEATDGWFDVAIGLDVEGHRIDLLPILRDVAQRADVHGDLANLGAGDVYYVRMPDTGITVAFPAQRLQTILGTLVELGDPAALRADGTLRLPRSRAAVVATLEASSGVRWDASQRLRELATRLRGFTGIAHVDVPASFRGELRPYQRDGLNWLQFLAAYGFGGILADDMGLGKSVQTLAHLLCEKEAGRLTRPALLVVPTSIVYNWRDEAARFAPSLRVLSLHGPTRAQRFDDIGESDLVITTYALLVRDALLAEREWHAVILDEAQSLKNPLAKAAQVAMRLRAAHRLCLTGTPVENHLGDLWSLFAIALPGALGDRKRFARIFRTPIEKRGDSERKRVLAERIAPFLLRRTKEAVASELPEKTEILQRVELAGAQRDLYETVRLAMHRRVRDEIEQRGLARSQIVILDALLKLRQVCCDPRLLPETLRKDAESVKLALLLEILPQMIEEGRRVLIFSQFTSMLDLIVPALETREIAFVMLTGRTNDREAVVKRFQSGAVPVFLISLKAGGTGLNLTAADTVIHYDPWWNPAVERQATDRAHRIGQMRHVFVYKLIAAGTVEEKIVDLQARKAQLAAAIFSERAAGSAGFAADDVERLFAPLEVS